MSDNELVITGQVMIVPCTKTDTTQFWYTILIMGPTGAGKSTFIEALAGLGPGRSLGISKDQLAGFTQDVSCYKMQNAFTKWSEGKLWPVYLIDTPGFSDSKLSEMEILNKVKGWMKDQGIRAINNILYLTPITDTRVPGSRRRTIRMLQSLLQYPSSFSSVTVVTTMWDQVCNTRAKERAEAHVAQLRDDIWKDLVNQGANVMRFQNDITSAIDVLRVAIKANKWSTLDHDPISVRDPSAPHLYQELLDRISNSRQEIESLRVDQLQLISHPDPLLESVVVPRFLETNQILAKFRGQLFQFGDPPLGFDGVPRQVIYQSLLDSVNQFQEYQRALEAVLIPLQAQSHPDPIRISTLQAQLKETKAGFRKAASELIKFGNPPKGFDLVVFPKDLLSPQNRARQGLHQAAHIFTSFTSKKR